MESYKKLDLVIETGFDFVMSATLHDVNDNIIDLTGATVDSQLRQFPEATDSFPFEVTHNGSGGRIKMKMSHTVTEKIPFTYGTYDVRIIFSDGSVHRPLEGNVTIVPGSTR